MGLRNSPVDLELADLLATLIGCLTSSDRSFLLLFDLVRKTSRESALSRLDGAAKVLDFGFARLCRVNVAITTAERRICYVHSVGDRKEEEEVNSKEEIWKRKCARFFAVLILFIFSPGRQAVCCYIRERVVRVTG